MAITLANYNAVLEWDASKFTQGMNTSSKEFETFKGSMTNSASALGKTITDVLTVASGASIAAGTYATAEASKYETALAKLGTIADTNKVPIQDLGESLKNLSNDTGVAASDLAEVAYNAISAGTDTADAVDMATTATKLAVGGFTDADSALKVLTTALNAYGDEAGSASDISDSLIQVQNLGVTTVGELSSSIGKAIAMGSGYGVSLSNIESSYISLTKQGIATAEATTYMNSMIKELGDSGSDVSQILQDKTGKSFGELMESGMSLGDVIGILQDSVDGNSEAFNQLWSSAEGGMAASAIVNNGLDEFNANLETLQNTSGETETAYSKMSDTFAFKMQTLKTNIANLASSIGETILPYVTKAVEKATEWVQKFGEMDESTKEMIVKIGGFVAILAPLILGITKVGTTIFSTINHVKNLAQGFSTMMTNVGGIQGIFAKVSTAISGISAPIVAVVAIIGVLVGAFVHLWNTNEDFRNNITQTWNNIVQTVQSFVQEIKEKLASVGITFESVTSTIKTIWEGLCQVLAPIFEGAFTVVSQVLSTVLGVLSGLLSVFIGVFTGDWSGAWEGVKQIFDSVWQGISSIFSTITSTIQGVADVFLGWFGTNWDSVWNGISTTFTNVWNGISSFISGIVDGIKGVLSFFFGGVQSDAETSTNNTRSTIEKGWGAIGKTIGTVGKGAQTLAKGAFTGIKNTASTLTNGAKTVVQKGWSALKSGLTTAANGAKSGATTAFNGLKSSVSSITNGIKSTANTGWNTIKSNTTKSATGIKSGVTTSFNGLKSSMNTALSGIKSNATTTFNGLKSSITTTVNSLKSSVTTTFNNLKSSISTAFSGIRNKAKSEFDSMANSLKSKASSIKSSIVNSFDGIKHGISSAMSSAKSRALSAWSGMSSRFSSVGHDIVRGIRNGVSSASGSLYSALRSLASRALAAAKAALGIHSPSRVFKDEVGKNIPLGIAEAIDEDKSVTNALEKLNSDAVKLSKEAYNGLDYGSTMASNASLDSFVSNAKSVLDSAVQGVTTATQSGVSTVRNLIVNMGDITVSGVLDKDASEQVRAIADEQVAQLDDALASVIPTF